jgi:hypothetical protein
MTVRLSALRTDRLSSLQEDLVLISVRDWVHTKAIVRLEGLGHYFKNPIYVLLDCYTAYSCVRILTLWKEYATLNAFSHSPCPWVPLTAFSCMHFCTDVIILCKTNRCHNSEYYNLKNRNRANSKTYIKWKITINLTQLLKPFAITLWNEVYMFPRPHIAPTVFWTAVVVKAIDTNLLWIRVADQSRLPCFSAF